MRPNSILTHVHRAERYALGSDQAIEGLQIALAQLTAVRDADGRQAEERLKAGGLELDEAYAGLLDAFAAVAAKLGTSELDLVQNVTLTLNLLADVEKYADALSPWLQKNRANLESVIENTVGAIASRVLHMNVAEAVEKATGRKASDLELIEAGLQEASNQDLAAALGIEPTELFETFDASTGNVVFRGRHVTAQAAAERYGLSVRPVFPPKVEPAELDEDDEPTKVTETPATGPMTTASGGELEELGDEHSRDTLPPSSGALT